MPTVEVFDEIDWAVRRTLRPGMDFHEGTTYYTIPLMRNVIIPAKGKSETKHQKELQTFVVSSDHTGFWYDEQGLLAEGFVPAPQIYQDQNDRWSRGSAKEFLDREAPTPATADVFEALHSTYTRYVEYSDDMAYDLMALYVMYTYVFRLFDVTGYIHYHGTAASGKSRNLAILNTLAFNTIWASSMSAASMYRKLAGSPGTTCIDETEGFDGERGEELRRILNAGYKDGAKVVRTEKVGEKFVPIEYDVFGPKALASISTLEPVIASRCIVIPMRPAIRELPDFETNSPEWQSLRDRLYLWAMDNAVGIAEAQREWRNDKKARLAPRLIGRAWETTRQFIILADYVGGEEFATRLITYFNSYFAKQQAAADALDRLRTTLRALPRVLNLKAAHTGNMYSVKDIHDVISSFMEEDSREAFKTKHVVKNLDVLGFRTKVRASGGVRIEIDEEALRAEFKQRRVEPYDEDTNWLAGKTSYQGAAPDIESFWEPKEDA